MIKRKTIARAVVIILCAAVLLNLPAFAGSRIACAASSDLFISEYVEGSGNNKAIELYNNTPGAIDLAAAGYSIRMYLNGSALPRTTVNLTGVIGAGEAFVLVEAHADAALLAYADQVAGGSWFNGSDAVVLMKGDAVIDQIGIIGQNPKPAWTGGGVSTANQTLVRKPDITQGATDNTPPYDPSLEWIAYPVDTFSNLGTHKIGAFSVSFLHGAHGTFDPSGAPATQQVPYGNAAAAPTVVADTGYIFTGWDQNFDAVYSDKTITALYVRAVYMVAFRAGAHGAFDPTGAPAAQQILYGEPAAGPTVVADDGYIFAGWDQSFNSVTRDMVITAQYVQKTFTVVFDPGAHGIFDPSGPPATQRIDFGCPAAAPIVLADAGYVFTGWDRSFDVVTQDRTVTAQYTRNLYKVVFAIGDGGVFNAGGGAQEQLILFGDTALRPVDPGRAGYTFGGWYTDLSYGVEFDFQTVIRASTVLYAKWVPASSGGNPGDDPEEKANDGTGTGTGNGLDPAPATGGPSRGLWIWILALSGIGLTGMGIQNRRTRNL